MTLLLDLLIAIGAATILFALLIGGLLWAVNPKPRKGK